MYVPRPQDETHVAIDVTAPSAAFTACQLHKYVGPKLREAAKLISQVVRR
jgi:DNA-binding IclR family transcriptional regulator